MSLSNKHSFWWKKGNFYIFELSVLDFFSIQRLIFQKYFEALKVCDLFFEKYGANHHFSVGIVDTF